MKVYGLLERAQLEHLSADPAFGLLGRLFINSVTKIPGYDNGTAIKYFADLNSEQTLTGKTITGCIAVSLSHDGVTVISLPTSTDTLVGRATTDTLTNKTLTAPVVDLFSMPHQATPAAPAAGSVKSYFKNDNKAYFLNSSGVEKSFDSGSRASQVVFSKYADISPVTEIVDGLHLENFSEVDAQELYALLTVPETYQAGTQVKLLNGSFFLNAIVGDVRFRCQTALLKNESTVLGTYTNSHTSTNVEADAPAVANRLKAIGEIDLTDATGQINGVAIAAGDKLRVKLYRDFASETVPAAAEAKLLVDNFQVRFSR